MRPYLVSIKLRIHHSYRLPSSQIYYFKRFSSNYFLDNLRPNSSSVSPIAPPFLRRISGGAYSTKRTILRPSSRIELYSFQHVVASAIPIVI